MYKPLDTNASVGLFEAPDSHGGVADQTDYLRLAWRGNASRTIQLVFYLAVA